MTLTHPPFSIAPLAVATLLTSPLLPLLLPFLVPGRCFRTWVLTISILSLSARPVSALDGLHLIKFCTFLSPFRKGLTNPGRALGRSCLLSISLKLLTLSDIQLFSTNLFRLASLLALFVGLNLSFLTARLRSLSKLQKSLLSSLSSCSARIRSWPSTFLSLHQ